MDIHLKFMPTEQRAFVEKIIKRSNLNVDSLANMVTISPRNFRDWRREKISLSKTAALLLSKKFRVDLPEKISTLEKRWKSSIVDRGRRGGIAYKIAYGNPGTIEGRKKGGTKTLKILRSKGVVPKIRIFKKPKHSEKFAEFVGIMLGDGSIGKLQISITLNSIKDLEYSIYVSTLSSTLFGSKPKIRRRKNANAIEIYYNGMNLVKFLISNGLVQGNKVKKQVEVPGWIKINQKYKILCLRGLMDTDGGIFIHKYRVNGKVYSYPKVNFTNSSLPLLDFVYETLLGLGFNPKIIKNIENKKVWLYNSHEVKKYLDLVGSSNLRLNQYKQGG